NASISCSAILAADLSWLQLSSVLLPKAHMLLRSRRANTFMEEIKPSSLERECREELCNFEEAREIFNTREATLEFWMAYKDGNQCDSNPCVHGKCVDLLQDYSCTCNAGFEGKHCGLTATNCSVNNGDCDHECHESVDGLGRRCSCIKGYQLQDNSRKCIAKSKANSDVICYTKYSAKANFVLQYIFKKCTVFLIDENWVLTAAHCLETSTRFSVRLVNNVVSFTISSSPKGQQSRMTDTVMMQYTSRG
uniref:Uncharacterized protein n=1 Tax=Sinocyclocheilus grahami TaxID=75366 RepID=A0A672SJ15_SINGR